MKLISKLTPEAAGLFSYTPLGYMLNMVIMSPLTGIVYADNELFPKTCVVRIGSLIFVGGLPTEECLVYIKNKILSYEVLKKYAVLYFFFPDISWREALTAHLKDICSINIYERSLYYTDSLPKKSFAPPPEIIPITQELMNSDIKNLEMITNEVTTYAAFSDFINNGIGYALVADKEICGFCTSEYQSLNELAIGIEVAEKYQRQGYAKAMTAAVLDKAIPRGFRVYWESWKLNSASINTALSCGFKKISDYPVVFADFREKLIS